MPTPGGRHGLKSPDILLMLLSSFPTLKSYTTFVIRAVPPWESWTSWLYGSQRESRWEDGPEQVSGDKDGRLGAIFPSFVLRRCHFFMSNHIYAISVYQC
jgi:hypothetical protein